MNFVETDLDNGLNSTKPVYNHMLNHVLTHFQLDSREQTSIIFQNIQVFIEEIHSKMPAAK